MNDEARLQDQLQNALADARVLRAELDDARADARVLRAELDGARADARVLRAELDGARALIREKSKTKREVRKRARTEGELDARNKYDIKLAQRDEDHKDELDKLRGKRKDKLSMKIDTLTNKIDQQTAGIDAFIRAISRRGNEIAGSVGSAVTELKTRRLNDRATIEEIKQESTVLYDALESKCKQSTMRMDETTRGYAVLAVSQKEHSTLDVKCVAGFEADVDEAVAALRNDGYDVKIEFQAIANTDDFLDNVRVEGSKLVSKRAREYNEIQREEGASARKLIDLEKPPVSFNTPKHVFRLRNMTPVSNPFLEESFDFQDFMSVEDILGVFRKVYERTIEVPYDIENLKIVCSDPSVDDEHTKAIEDAANDLNTDSSVPALTSLLNKLIVDPDVEKKQ